MIQAYCPIVRGQRFEEPVLKGLVEKYKGKTAAQVLLRWSLQKVCSICRVRKGMDS